MKIFNYIAYILVLCLALIIEATFFSNLKLYGANPNLILVIIVSMTFFLSKEKAMIMAGIAGLLEDFFIGSMIGSNLLALVAMVYLITSFSSRIIRENIITPIIVIFTSSLAYYVLMGIILIISSKGYLLGWQYLNSMVFGSIYNVMLAIVVYPATYLIFHGVRKGDMQ